MTAGTSIPPLRQLAVTVLLVGLLSTAIAMIFLVAPVEETMGEVQKVLYLHVSVAWCGLAACVVMGGCGAAYLARRRAGWDHTAQAAAEVGWLCETLTLVTGSLWAHEAWGVWWTWEPRLTSAFVLWLIYGGVLLARSGIEDRHRRARTAAVLGLLGVCDLPMVIMATRWFRGVHPITPEMDPQMRVVLLVSVVAFTAFFAALVLRRGRQLALAERVADLEAHLDAACV